MQKYSLIVVFGLLFGMVSVQAGVPGISLTPEKMAYFCQRFALEEAALSDFTNMVRLRTNDSAGLNRSNAITPEEQAACDKYLRLRDENIHQLIVCDDHIATGSELFVEARKLKDYRSLFALRLAVLKMYEEKKQAILAMSFVQVDDSDESSE